MKKQLLTIASLFVITITFSQIGIGNTAPNPETLLDVGASGVNTKGILIPRVDIADLTTIAPITGGAGTTESLLVYNTNATTGKGFYYWNGTNLWVALGNVKRIDDLLDGKSDVGTATDGSSIFLGINAGASDNASDNQNIGIGFNSLTLVDGSANDGSGEKNTAVGYLSLAANTTGKNNTAIGHIALANNDVGKNNVAIGKQALTSNTSGDSNVAVGSFTLPKTTTGKNNVAVGNQAMRFNVTGEKNTALGDYALRGSLASNTGNDGSSFSNLALGNNTLQAHETGDGNVAIGDSSLKNNVSGAGNVAIGFQAGVDETGNNKLYIENSGADANNALIYGEFDTDLVRVNGKIETEGLKVGDTNGTVLTEVIKVTVTKNIPNIVAGNFRDVDFVVTGASNPASVHISPQNALPRGVIISYAKVQGADNVRVRFFNAHSNDQNPGAMDFYITVIE